MKLERCAGTKGRMARWAAGRRMLLTGVLATASAGCYSYARIEAVDVREGELVRARITAVELDRLEARGQLPGDSRVLEGRAVASNGDGLMIEVPSATRRSGAGVEILHQRIILEPGGVLELERKQLDRLRTGGVLAGGVAVLTAVVLTQLRGDPGKDDRPGPGPVERRPRSFILLRIHP